MKQVQSKELSPEGELTSAACLGVRVLVDEMHNLASGGRPRSGVARRRSLCHLRQIAMYVCHVVLQMSLTDIGLAFGRDRTTVGHACKVIEDRRDDQAYDEFVSAIERVTAALSNIGTEGSDERN